MDEMTDRFEDVIGQVHAKAQVSAFGDQAELLCSIRASPVLTQL
jgi:hypothetical protein